MIIRQLRADRPTVLRCAWAVGALLLAQAALANPMEPIVRPSSAPVSPPAAESSVGGGAHDLICKPNGSEDGFDCANEATPARIVPVPYQILGPRVQDQAITG